MGKKERIGLYITFSDNTTKYISTFKKSVKSVKFIKFDDTIQKKLNREYKIRKSEEKAIHNEYVRHIEHLKLTELQLYERAIHKNPTVEEIVCENEAEKEIKQTIWNLPLPQNRRVYMYIVDGFSLTEISKIEKCSIPAIKYSIEIGLKNLRKNLKKFLN